MKIIVRELKTGEMHVIENALGFHISNGDCTIYFNWGKGNMSCVSQNFSLELWSISIGQAAETDFNNWQNNQAKTF